MSPSTCFTRRQFLRAAGRTAAALAAASAARGRAFGRTAANNRIQVACIGTGNQGFQDLQAFLAQDDVQVVAVCDVNRASGGYKTADQFLGREPARKLVDSTYAAQTRSGTYRGCAAHEDFREVLARPDVDAVSIVVPDHWHRTMTEMAAAAGKDIYCEKPLGLTVEDGRAMAEAVRRHGVVLQTGSHERSRPQTRFVCEQVRNGRIGRLQRIVAVVGPWNKKGPEGAWTPEPVPEGFDYERWLGPAPWAPYHPARCLYNFRFNLDYSGGQVTNYGAHSLDMAQWGNGADGTGPVEFEDAGASGRGTGCSTSRGSSTSAPATPTAWNWSASRARTTFLAASRGRRAGSRRATAARAPSRSRCSIPCPRRRAACTSASATTTSATSSTACARAPRRPRRSRSATAPRASVTSATSRCSCTAN